ncbi:hypothetical protein [Spartinivicinus poritis]|uniref:Uncharacterized protein n=1 Tax=Spartinivicinus poritis TaxID=2994640 RepID=A0ABT5UJ35_9GAMM|nr:hypothetical protein [Spartinivicinus sp. A2-2]MDE1465059.1 hypothetical protein [Spartinivicinus sp. A2-2]
MLLNILAILFGILTGYFIVAKIDKPPLVVQNYKVIPASQLIKHQLSTDNSLPNDFKVASQVSSIKPYNTSKNK